MVFSIPLIDKATCLPISNNHWLQGSTYQVSFCLMTRSECWVGRGQAEWRWSPYHRWYSWDTVELTEVQHDLSWKWVLPGAPKFRLSRPAPVLILAGNPVRPALMLSTYDTPGIISSSHTTWLERGSLWEVSHSVSPGNASDPWLRKRSKPGGRPLPPKSAKYSTDFLTNTYFTTLLSLCLYIHALNIIGFWVLMFKSSSWYAPVADNIPWGIIIPYYKTETKSSLFICCGI